MGFIDVMEKERKLNNKQRLEWVIYWADYMGKVSNEVWSKQQADLINSVMRSADVNPENYIKVKKVVSGK